MVAQAAAHEAVIAERGGYARRRRGGHRPRFSSRWPKCTPSFMVCRFRWVNNYLRWHSADSGSGSGNSSCEQLDNLGSFISNIRDLEIVQT